MKILLIDDERDLVDAIKKVLEMNSYQVITGYDGEEALYLVMNNDVDLVILDVMMPKLDGISVVKAMRERNNHTPVLMLTAKAMIDDKVLGLDSGADDYLTKPFSIKELLARIKALLRRNNSINETLSFSNMHLNSDTFELCAEKNIRLTNKEYRLIEYLMQNPNVILSSEKIFNYVWEYDTESEINVVWVFISSLRKKMKSINAKCIINAYRGVGYKLELL